MSTPEAILTIAGSDPSGGAGIQADLKTFSSLGVYGCAAISCLTVQNTLGVHRVVPVEAELVRDQVEKVLEDLSVSHIKLGMLVTSEIISTVGNILTDFPGKVICDPVIRSSSGKDLLQASAIEDLHTHIIGNSSAITPNSNEFQALSGVDPNNGDISSAVDQLFANNNNLEAVVLKGGHLDEQSPTVIDTLFYKDGNRVKVEISKRPRIKTNNTHGTGCTFASALTAYHKRAGDWLKAFGLTSTYMDKVLTNSTGLKIGQGPGPLHHHLFRQGK